MNFRDALLEELAKVPHDIKDIHIARSAGIEPSTPWNLKAERGRTKRPTPDLRMRLAIAIAIARESPTEGLRIAEKFLSDILKGHCLNTPPRFWSPEEKADWTIRFNRLNIGTAWNNEDLLRLWPQVSEELRKRHYARADQLKMALQLADLGFQNLRIESSPVSAQKA